MLLVGWRGVFPLVIPRTIRAATAKLTAAGLDGLFGLDERGQGDVDQDVRTGRTATTGSCVPSIGLPILLAALLAALPLLLAVLPSLLGASTVWLRSHTILLGPGTPPTTACLVS